MTNHSITPELLLDYSTGALAAAPALAVATHIALRPDAHAAHAGLNRVGGLLLEDIGADHAVDDREMAAMMDRLDQAAQDPAPAPAPADDGGVPAPLRALTGPSLNTLRWRMVGPGVREYKLPLDDGRHKVVLLSIAPGRAVPRHCHRGQELTLVLEGGYCDGAADYARGDLQIADETVDHRPVADPREGCICLVVLDAPIRFTGPWARWINGLVRY